MLAQEKFEKKVKHVEDELKKSQASPLPLQFLVSRLFFFPRFFSLFQCSHRPAGPVPSEIFFIRPTSFNQSSMC